MWPVCRSTSSHGPRCQTQVLAARAVLAAGAGFTLDFSLGPDFSLSPDLSLGRLSLSLITRLTTKLRSVTSWLSPVVHSFTTPSRNGKRGDDVPGLKTNEVPGTRAVLR